MKLEKYVFAPVVAAVLLLLPCSGMAAQSPDQTTILARQLVQQIMKEQRIPALQVAVIKDNQIVLSDTSDKNNAISNQFSDKNIYRCCNDAAGRSRQG